MKFEDFLNENGGHDIDHDLDVITINRDEDDQTEIRWTGQEFKAFLGITGYRDGIHKEKDMDEMIRVVSVNLEDPLSNREKQELAKMMRKLRGK